MKMNTEAACYATTNSLRLRHNIYSQSLEIKSWLIVIFNNEEEKHSTVTEKCFKKSSLKKK